tara:strand:- start:212 stop:685 length:474 start_codon:yes stop_codon:yes gene_type:complete
MEIKETNLFNNFQKTILLIFIIISLILILFFKNTIFASAFLIKSFGNLSMDPEIAFSNKRPTYLEFYAEWCEVCKKMAPDIVKLKNDFDDDFNFVFLNVDNPKWDKLVKQFHVNGIPQINIIDSDLNVITTINGLQEENDLKQSIQNLINSEEGTNL